MLTALPLAVAVTVILLPVILLCMLRLSCSVLLPVPVCSATDAIWHEAALVWDIMWVTRSAWQCPAVEAGIQQRLSSFHDWLRKVPQRLPVHG